MKILSMIAAAGALTSYLISGVVLLTGEPILGGAISGWMRFSISCLLFALFFIQFERAYLRDDESNHFE